MSKIYTLDELFTQDEEERRAKTLKEIAEEKAMWDALSQSEKDRLIAEREAKLEAFAEACESAEKDEDDEEEDET